jgi:hypothetical protein
MKAFLSVLIDFGAALLVCFLATWLTQSPVIGIAAGLAWFALM